MGNLRQTPHDRAVARRDAMTRKANEAKRQAARRPNERTLLERFADSFEDFVTLDGPVAQQGRQAAVSGNLEGYEPGQAPGPRATRRMSHDEAVSTMLGQREQRRQAVVADYERRDTPRRAREAADPARSPGDHMADFGGIIAGSVVADPTTWVAPGATAARRIGAQAGISGGIDLAGQTADVATGVRDEIDPLQVGLNTAVGGVTQGVGEVGVKLLRALRQRNPRAAEQMEANAPEGQELAGVERGEGGELTPVYRTVINQEDKKLHELGENFRRWELRDQNDEIVEYGNIWEDGPITRWSKDHEELPVTREFESELRSQPDFERRAEPRGAGNRVYHGSPLDNLTEVRNDVRNRTGTPGTTAFSADPEVAKRYGEHIYEADIEGKFGDPSNPEDVEAVIQWRLARPGPRLAALIEEDPSIGVAYEERVRREVAAGQYALWENKDLWRDMGWEGAWVNESGGRNLITDKNVPVSRRVEEPVADDAARGGVNTIDMHQRRVDNYTKLVDDPNAKLDDISDAIEYLDEAYAQGRDVGDLQDRLMARESAMQAGRRTSNDNTPDTPRDAINREINDIYDEWDKVDSVEAEDAIAVRAQEVHAREAAEMSDAELTQAIDFNKKFLARGYRAREAAYAAEQAKRNPQAAAGGGNQTPPPPEPPRGPEPLPERPRRTGRKVGSIGPRQGAIPESLEHVPNVDAPTSRSKADTAAAGDELGLDADNLGTDGKIGDVSAIAARGAAIVEEASQNLLRAYDEFGPGSDEYLEALVALEKAANAHSKNSSELGRGLNALNRTASPEDAKGLVEIANDPVKGDKLKKLIEKYKNDPDAIAKIVRDMRDPSLRDIIFSVRYNMMLSGPKTHFYNIVGTFGNQLLDIATHGLGFLLDTPRRMMGETDVISGREVASRVHGLIAGARAALPNIKQAWAEGRPLDGVIRDDGDRRVMGWELATKAMSAEDEFFRTAANTSAIYGLAARQGFSEGLDGRALDQRINQLVELASLPKKVRGKLDKDADTEIADKIAREATDYAKRIRFQDDPSFIGRMIEGMRTRKKGDGPLEALGKDALTLVLPFVRTPDSLARTALRYSPVGVLSGTNIRDWKAGGARRRLAESRVILGTGVTATIASWALDGTVTGEGPRNYKERQALEESGNWQANSIKIGDKWYSYEGMEPLSILLNGVATTIERWDEGSSEDYLDQAGRQVFNAAEVLTNTTWTEGVNDLFQVMSAPDETRRGDMADNFFANIAASFVVPAAVRQVNQSYVDPVVRETRGDDSMWDRISNRVQSGIPGLSDNLPAQHDSMGREIRRGDAFGPDIISRATSPGTPPDNVSNEVSRLSEVMGKPVIERVDKSLNTKAYPMGRLSGLEQQNYQLVTGTYFSAVMEEALASPEYQAMTDEQKAEYVNKAMTQAREWAREEVFSAPEEGVPEGNQSESPEAQPTEDGEEFTFGIPTSMRRTEAGNKAVGGVENSSHLTGDGIDFVRAPGVSWAELEREARRFFGPDATVIFEGDHVHVSLPGLDAPLYGDRGTI